MRFFCTFSGGLAAFLSILLLSGCGGGSSTSTPPPAPPPPPNPVQVTVALSGSGSGTVTSTPAGIDCGKSCSQTFSAGTQVTLNATPATGFTFAGWSGACTGTGACTLPTTGAQSVTASFGTTVASLQSINHIIFMVQENRGFDHYFGHLNGYRTAPPYNSLPRMTLPTADLILAARERWAITTRPRCPITILWQQISLPRISGFHRS